MPDQFFSGVLEDPRKPDERLTDFHAEEIIASYTPVNWVEKPKDTWRKFPIRNQDGSSTCVAQTLAKILGIDNQRENGRFIDFSASYIYNRRANKPAAGMWGIDSLKIASEQGSTFEQFVPSQNMGEDAVAAVKDLPEDSRIGKIYKGGGYIQLPFDIDAIASVIQQTGKGVMTWFRFNYIEWTNVPFLTTGYPNCHHSVTAVDFTLWEGKKALIIEDSWGEQYGFGGQRVITEDFMRDRMTFCAYLLDLSNVENTVPLPTPVPPTPVVTKPKHFFTTVLTFGMKNGDVKALQDILKFEGLFPKNVDSTGYYGAVTAKAVLQFQILHKVAPLSELNPLQGRRVGLKTIAVLNQLYK